MKKEQILVLLFLVFSILTFLVWLNFWKRIWDENLQWISGTWRIVDKKLKFSSWALLNKWKKSAWTGGIEWSWTVHTGTGILEVDTKIECEKVIDWGNSELIDQMTWWSSLLLSYKWALDVLEKNEYNEIISIKNKECLNLSTEENRKFCNIYASNDVNKVDLNYTGWTMDYVLLVSLFSNTNKCNQLSDTSDIDSCNNFLDVFSTSDNDVSWKDVLFSNAVDKWKLYMKLWKEKYLSILKKQFINECNKLSLDK